MLLVPTAKMPLEEAALVTGTYQNLSDLIFLGIYGLPLQLVFSEAVVLVVCDPSMNEL